MHTESAGELRSFSASSRRGTNILRLEVSYSSAVEMAYAVEDLLKLQGSLKAARLAARKKQPPLALPAPQGPA